MKPKQTSKTGTSAARRSLRDVVRPRSGSEIARMLKAYSKIISVLNPLTPESRIRVIRATSIILGNEV